jgi:hypothetical protein
MDPRERLERKRQAQDRIGAQRARAGRLKSRVVAISLICFALLWGIVFVQMATGNDPVLGGSSSTVEVEKAAFAEEPVREEPVEAEAEPVEEVIEEEPAPVTTGQS